MKNLKIIILAAGKGKRFKSALPKVLHKVVGKPMIEIVLLNATNLIEVNNIYLVVGHNRDLVMEIVNKKFKGVNFVIQDEQKGTGHAVLCCQNYLKNFNGYILILCGDMPLVESETLKNFINFCFEKNLDIGVISAEFENPYGYGRIIKENGKFIKIVEEKDASYEEKKIKEINTGVYCVKSKILFELLEKISNKNAQNEYYLTDIIEIGSKNNLNIEAYLEKDSIQFLGINTRVELSIAENILINRKIKNLMLNGVTFIKPETSFIGLDVEIGKDTVVYPGNFITGDTKIGDNCIIGMNNYITDSEIENNVNIKGFCYIENSKISSQSQIGPFSHLRPESIIGKKCKIGNFVETKKVELKDGVKASHLTYLGDTFIDEGTNVGAGTITCNYDGIKKHKTYIGKNVFIGSDTQLVAPVKIGDYALIAAGTTVTKDVEENSLVHSRVKQQEIKNKGMKYKLESKK